MKQNTNEPLTHSPAGEDRVQAPSVCRNPVIRGFHPDPSVCRADGKYYLVCSSFQYFPGIPLFESTDLINWQLIGHVLDRPGQLPLDGADASGGIYAPTIRSHNGRFYVVSTNVSGMGNFLVWTDDISGPWSDPLPIDQDGIDPSLYFEEDRVYFMSNHGEPDGTACIMQCEIDPLTGARLTESRSIWKGCGGRYLEGPHLYRINGWYYLLAAEGGTEYGHMAVLARGLTPYGPFENSPRCPIVSNRDLGGYPLQGTGHGDLIQDPSGGWWMVLLAFRQMEPYMPYHYLGRETCLIPVSFLADGWVTAGDEGTVRQEIPPVHPALSGQSGAGTGRQQRLPALYTFENTRLGYEWVFLRRPERRNYTITRDTRNAALLTLSGTEISLSDTDGSPTFLGLRLEEMTGTIQVRVRLPRLRTDPSRGCNSANSANSKDTADFTDSADFTGSTDFTNSADFTDSAGTGISCAAEAGLTLYMDSRHHYDFALRRQDPAGTGTSGSSKPQNRMELIKRRTIGDLSFVQQSLSLPAGVDAVLLHIDVTARSFRFWAELPHDPLCPAGPEPDRKTSPDFGTAMTQYLSSEVAGGFTGVMIGLYAVNTGADPAEFGAFEYYMIRE